AEVLDYGLSKGLEFSVYPLCGMSLHKLLRVGRLLPLTASHLRNISWQLLRAVDYMHSLNLIHTDIKPANIVLRSDRIRFDRIALPDGDVAFKEVLSDVSIKLIDLDDAVSVGPRWMSLVGTDSYRAPEVVVGGVWLTPIDLFSVGCVMAELLLGYPLFKPDGGLEELLACLERTVG
ncbi:kinase-like domain-containing protein, partial [Mycena crocata]